jgi:hypothetical protein
MATKEQLEGLLKALLPVLNQLEEIEKTYGGVLREYRQDKGIVTEEDRTDAAIRMIHKYSNL